MVAKKKSGSSLPHGEILGYTACGLPAYNCNYKNMKYDPDYQDNHYDNGRFCGYKWQCVEFARRYWLFRHDVALASVNWAAHIYNVKSVIRLSDQAVVPLLKYESGVTKEMPKKGDLLIYRSTPGQVVGHVAVVLEVLKDRVRVGE